MEASHLIQCAKWQSKQHLLKTILQMVAARKGFESTTYTASYVVLLNPLQASILQAIAKW